MNRILVGPLAALISTAALADCPMRDQTPAEVEHYKRVAAALKQALPPAPQGWTLAPLREGGLGSVCADDPPGKFEITVSASYSYRPPKEEGDRLYAEHRKLQSQIDALRQLPPATAKERQALLDKMSEANRASNRASKEGNKQLARQKDAEAEDYSAKGRALRDRYLASVRQEVEKLEARQSALEYRGSAVSLRLVANDRGRSSDPNETRPIVVGKVPAPQSPGLKVHNVVVFLSGSATRRAAVEGSLDKEKFARIVR